MASDPELNLELCLGTDIASFFIFHPDDLAHRLDAPLGWSTCGYACRKEFDAGRLVTWATGGDGGFGFRMTTGELTERERQWRVSSWDFRLRVGHGRVLLDGGDALPVAEYYHAAEEDHPGWFALPNGDYRVTVSDLNWTAEPGAVDEDGNASPGSLSSYVIQFVPVEDLQTVVVKSNVAPSLLGDPNRDPSSHFLDSADGERFEEDKTPLEPSPLVILATPRWLVMPDCQTEETISDELYQTLFRGESETKVVLTNAAAVGQFAMLCSAEGAERRGEEPWRVHLRSRRLVRLVELKNERAGFIKQLFSSAATKDRIEAVERSFVEAPPEQLAELQARFANYAAQDPRYRAEVKHADFVAEGFAWLKTTEGITNRLLDLLQIPLPQKLEIFLLSPPERIAPLAAILEQAGY